MAILAGEINYRKFCELVMGSTKNTASSLAIGGNPDSNSDMMIRRKLRESFKHFRATFRDMIDANGTVSQENLRWALSNYDIDMSDQQFNALLAALDTDGAALALPSSLCLPVPFSDARSGITTTVNQPYDATVPPTSRSSGSG